MMVDKRCIKSFNIWWRKAGRQFSPPSNPLVIEAFEAGFKAGMELAVAEATKIIKGEKT